MTHGEPSIEPAIPAIKNTHPREGRSTSQAAIANDEPTSQEEKARVFNGVEQVMELFRKGECTRFQAVSLILNELEMWTGASDKEKGKAFDSYLTEINAFFINQEESQSITREISSPPGTTLEPKGKSKRVRDEADEFLDQISRGEPEDNDNKPRVIRRKAKEDEMPWYNNTAVSTRRNSCAETCRILLQFSEDLSGVKSLLRVANNLPEGIPSSQWDRLLRGESVDLNQILSSMHFFHLDEERKGRVGTTEVVFAVAESKRQVRTGAEWSSAFRRMSKVVAFLFPHRREELLEYAEHIEGLFSTKHVSAHSKVILYDQSVRNQVGGGQNILLTDYQRFSGLSEEKKNSLC